MIKKSAKSISRTKSDKVGKLIVALMSSDTPLISEIEQRLIKEFGAIDLVSNLFLFDHTDYYIEEMGTNLQKKFISFSEMIPVETLPDIKLFTNDVEQHYVIGGKRRINIDPGYVTHAQLVLATTKDRTHRIYLGKGIHADLTYFCLKKIFRPLEWTYPDYREPLAIDFFHKVREKYLQQMREQREVSKVS